DFNSIPNTFSKPGSIKKLSGIELKSGRFFKPNTLSDTSKVIINESFATEAGWEDPIGKKLLRNPLSYEVVGVVKDFNFRSLKNDINSMIFRYGADVADVGMWHQRNILIKYDNNNLKEMIEHVEETWNSFMPDYPLDSRFLDDSFNRLYDGEKRFGKTFTTFSVLAILIAFLGLFSLTTFILQRRFKEIAIRKVMGATVPSLLRMIIKEFTFLVIIGGAVGITASAYWLNEWLSDYSYRISLSWYLLTIPVIIILSLTWMIVSIRSYKAATLNPAHVLKDE
ncbi:MAG: FtsX-like permease family protein, partial [Bacteroidota bacterium]